MRNKVFFWLILLYNPCISQQNLVPNGSFEILTSCPNDDSLSTSQIELAQPWWNACKLNNPNTPDVFNPCNSGIYKVPNNFKGFEEAYSGDGYAGFGAWSGLNGWTEHFEVKLTNTIKANAQYRFCFHLSLADYAGAYGLRKLRFSLTLDSLIGIDSAFFNPLINPFPSINVLDLYETSSTTEVSYDNWVEVCTDFTLNQNANYLTIGTFIQTSLNTDTFLINNEEPWALSNYYFIDDVSLICITPSGCDGVGVEEVEQQLILQISPNPSNNLITLKSPLIKSGANLFLRDLSGRLIRQLKIQELNQYELSTHDLADGIYLVQIIGEDGRQVRDRFVVQHDGIK